MPKPRGFSSEFGMSFDRGPYRYALVPWQWNQSDAKFKRWELPNAVGMIDMRPFPAQSSAGGAPQGFAFCCSTTSIPGDLVAQVPHLSDANATASMMDVWQTKMGYRPQGSKLADLLWDQLTTGADPSGDAGPKPLMPTTGGQLELWLGGHSLVKAERFRWGIHPHTNRVQAVLQRDFDQLWEQSNGAEHCRKVLGFNCRKYGLTGDDWRLLVPARLRAHVPAPRDPETTITESFNTADTDTLGPDLSWTEMVAGIIPLDWARVVGNQYCCDTGSAADQAARANSDLSGTDHYAQLSATALGAGSSNLWIGATTRFSASDHTCYVATAKQFDDTIALYKIVSGTMTLLGSPPSITISVPQLVKCEINGTTLKSYWAGAEEESITDSAISTGLRCGIQGFNAAADTTSVLGDSFEAADLGAATGHPAVKRFGGVQFANRVGGAQGRPAIQAW